MSNDINDNNGNKNDEEQIKENDGGNIIMEGKNFFDVDIRKKKKVKGLTDFEIINDINSKRLMKRKKP